MINRLLSPLPGLLVALAACQNYEFHAVTAVPVSVIHQTATFGADAGPAYIMIVQDTSGSMCEPIAATGVAVDSSGCATTVAESKLGLISTDFSQVLQSLVDGGAFFIGLTAFPEPGGVGCSPPTASIFPVGPAPPNIPKIVSWYASATPADGTPTAGALQQASKDPSLVSSPVGSSRYIILLTDGYPNCNGANACVTDPTHNLWSDGQAHGCMSASAAQLKYGSSVMPPAQCACGQDSCAVDPATNATIAAYQCLDNANTDAILAQLHASGITTFVVGVGSGFTDYTVLDAMAQAGSGNPSASAFQANNQGALLAAIQSVIGTVLAACDFTISPAPADPRLIQVTLDGTNLALGDATNGFTFNSTNNALTLGTAACNTVKSGSHTVDITALAQL